MSPSALVGPPIFFIGGRQANELADIELEGVVVGQITARKLETSKDAKIKGTLKGERIVVGGHFEGTIDADKVELSSTANVEGEITSASLSMDEEAYLGGTAKRSPSKSQ